MHTRPHTYSSTFANVLHVPCIPYMCACVCVQVLRTYVRFACRSIALCMTTRVHYIERIKVNVRRDEPPLSQRASLPLPLCPLRSLLAFGTVNLPHVSQLGRIDTKTHRIDTRVDTADGPSSSSAASCAIHCSIVPRCHPLLSATSLYAVRTTPAPAGDVADSTPP
jgi:hypothetical protein